MAAVFKNLLRVLACKEVGAPSLLEGPLPLEFCQQIIWRAGPEVWATPKARALAQADACRWCGFDCVPASLEPSVKDEELCQILKGRMKFIQVLPSLRLAQQEGVLFEKFSQFLLDEIRRSCTLQGVGGVMLRENWAGVKEKKLREQVLPALSRLAKRAHEQGKPFLLECCQGCDQVMDQLICCGIDARGGFWDSETPIEEALGKWWGKIALFGGLDSQFLTTNGPKTIQHRCRRLMEDTGNKGYAIGVSEIPGQQIEYLKRIALLGAVQEA